MRLSELMERHDSEHRSIVHRGLLHTLTKIGVLPEEININTEGDGYLVGLWMKYE